MQKTRVERVVRREEEQQVKARISWMKNKTLPKSQIFMAIIFPLQTLKTGSKKLSASPWLAHTHMKPSVTHDLLQKFSDHSVLPTPVEEDMNFMPHHNAVLPTHTLH